MSFFDFDPTEAEPSTPRGEVIPAGKYAAMAILVEIKEPNGCRHLNYTFEVTQGEKKGARLWNEFKIWNVNDMVQEIARRDFSALLQSVGFRKGDDLNPEDVIGRELCLTVKYIPAGTVDKGKNGKPDYTHTTDKNQISGYEPIAAYVPRDARPVQTSYAARPPVQPAQTAYAPRPTHQPIRPPQNGYAAPHNAVPANGATGAPFRPWDQPRA